MSIFFNRKKRTTNFCFNFFRLHFVAQTLILVFRNDGVELFHEMQGAFRGEIADKVDIAEMRAAI